MAWQLAQNDIVEITVFGSCFGQNILNTFHYKNTGPSEQNGSAALADLLTKIIAPTGWKSQFLSAHVGSYFCDQFRAQVIYPTRRPFEFQGLSQVGTRAGSATTTNTAAVITFYQKNVAKKGRIGSFHISPVATEDCGSGQLLQAYQTVLNTLGNAMLQTFPMGTAAIAEPTLWSRAPNTANNPLKIEAMHVQTTVRTMHRRTVGLGI